MIPPKFITFEQADTGLPGAVCPDTRCEVESVYALRRVIADPLCECGHPTSSHAELRADRVVIARRCAGDNCACEELRPVVTDETRSVIRMRTGQKYEVRDSVADVVGRIESVYERDG